MRLLSSYMPHKYRSAFRFFVIGTTGMFVQTWLFMGALYLMGEPDKGTAMYYLAFAIGYVLEMVPNYLLSNWYTFGTRPGIKNASGFIIARGINMFIQLALLPWMISILPTWRDDWISYLVIFIGGCINYIVCLFFFKKPQQS